MSAAITHVHGHAEHHDPHLQHHFTEPQQQFDAAKIGMWLFLATEILLFGGLFVGFGIMQMKYPAAFFQAHHHLDRSLGFLNTVVLLISSYTMVMAVQAAKQDKRKALMMFLTLTIVCACIFLGVKYIEYSHKIHEGLLPGRFYSHGPHTDAQFMFFSFYFMMTGLHGFHIVGGIALLTWILVRSAKGQFSSSYYTPVDLAGLYWHLVDMIWIYLFPLLYLIS